MKHGTRTIHLVRIALTCLRVFAVFAFVELLIRWVPLPRLAQLLGVHLDVRAVGSAPRTSPVVLSPAAQRQLKCAWWVAARWPFGAGPCLRRSLATAHLLRSSGAMLRIGFPNRPAMSVAHAWVEIDRRPLEDVSLYVPFTNSLVGIG